MSLKLTYITSYPNMLSRNIYRRLLILPIFLGPYSHGQECNSDSLFNAFREDIQTEMEVNHGEVIKDDETDEAFYQLLSSCPVETLRKYTDDSIPAVRAEIFMGLVLKNADEKILCEILNEHLNDTAEFTLSPTDVVMTWTVRGYMQFGLDYKVDNKVINVDLKDRLEQIRKRPHFNPISGVHHKTISKDSLLKTDSLISYQGYRIISFLFGAENITIQADNNVVTNQMKGIIKGLKPGQHVYFDNIRAELPDKRIVTVHGIDLKIK